MAATQTKQNNNAFVLPPRRTAGLTDEQPLAVREVAQRCVAEASAPLRYLLEKQANWAFVALFEQQSRCSCGKLLGALRRFEVAELEVARAKAVRSDMFEDWAPALSSELVDAMRTPLNVDRVVFSHRRLVVDGLRTLQRLERETARANRPQQGNGGGRKASEAKRAAKKARDREQRAAMRGRDGQKPQRGKKS